MGVIALAVLGGGGGTLAYALFGGSNQSGVVTRAEVEPDNAIVVAEDTSGGAPIPKQPTEETVDGPSRMPAETGTVSEEPPTPKPRAPIAQNFIKAGFVVRFNAGGEVDECLQLYRKDKDASRAAFAEWAAQHPELDGMHLQRVNYSGEAILTYDGAEDANPLRSAKQIQARLQSLAAVKYADPDYTAFPGKGD